MKRFIVIVIVLVVVINLVSIAQITKNIDAYKMENDGYYSNLSFSEYGIIATDNYASKLYLITNGSAEVLISSAGCGRYYSLSPDKKKIGFKYIGKNGKQTPAILDILTKTVTPLHSAVDLCGQVSFSDNGTVAFTIENILYVINETSTQTFDLGVYSNYVSISPDATKAIYNDNSDQLIAINFINGSKLQITNNTTGFVYPKWSPDGLKILFNSLAGDLFVYSLQTDRSIKLENKATGAVWHSNSHDVFYQKNYSENFEFKGTDIFKIGSDGNAKVNLTNTADVNEMAPYVSGNTLVYHTYDRREIIEASLINNNKSLENKTLLIKHSGALEINYFNTKQSTKAIIRIPGTVPYVHQVYDTPEWHYGYGSCAPTTSVMAFAYYNLLPKWPIQTSNGAGTHTSDYGAYVADKYRYREVYYQDVSATGGGEDSWGGYGYLWTGSYSPNSRMKIYIENHGLVSNQLWTTSCTYANTTTEIDLGYPHPICNYLTSSGHLTLAIGYLSTQHTLIFNDPYGNKNNPGYPNVNGADAYYDWPGYSNGYANLDASGSNGCVAWTVKARGSEVTYNDTIIDDVFYNHGFYVNNTQNTSTQRYFRDQITGGYNNHFWYTGTMAGVADICYVTWTPTLTDAGNYEIFAYIPGGANSNAAGSVYKIHHSNGVSNVVVDQSLYTAQWVSLGTYLLDAGQNAYVYLGDSTGTASQMIAFDAMKFSKIGSTDHSAPSTSVSTQGTWKTSDFIANFTDQDNSGGSGVEKSYYQVLDYDGQFWGANSDHGFFADNFETLNTSLWSVPANGGTWTVGNGYLKQTDSTITNTNIYASLNQNLSNRSLYHFSAKMESVPYSTNQRRFGFHFFCDTGSTLNRSNSYFIFFRQETSKLEFYKVVNNVSALVKTVDNVITAIGQLYDYKIIYDRITGKISVYRDDILLSSWTDSAPLTNAGNYISFRSGNCKVSISELKIFRSRNASVSVTMGSVNADIRYQNAGPLISSAKIKSIVADSAGNISPISYHDLNIDWTAPSNFIVYDGIGADIDTTVTSTELSANWTSSSDPNSDILRYMYAIGTSPGSNNFIDWTDNGTATYFTQTGLNLQNGQHYYVSVFAENNAGLNSDTIISDGLYMINVPVAAFLASSQNICQGDSVYFTNTSTNATSYHWSFENGFPSESTSENPVVVFNIEGTYNVQLVAAGQGGSDTLTQNSYITVSPQAIADFNTNVINGPAPLTVLFNNNSTNADGYIWNFGEGNLATDVNPYHIYNIAGDYVVSLVCINYDCGNDTAFVNIHVDSTVGIFENGNCNAFSVVSQFSQEILFEYEISSPGKVRIVLYDVLGKELATCLNADQIAGKYRLQILTNAYPSGIYFCKFEFSGKENIWQKTEQVRIIR